MTSSFGSAFDECIECILSHYKLTKNDLFSSAHDVTFDAMFCRMSHNVFDKIPSKFIDNV